MRWVGLYGEAGPARRPIALRGLEYSRGRLQVFRVREQQRARSFTIDPEACIDESLGFVKRGCRTRRAMARQELRHLRKMFSQYRFPIHPISG
jgi:hypothetical protein